MLGYGEESEDEIEDEVADEVADEVDVEEEIPEIDEPSALKGNIVSFSNFGGSNLVGVSALDADPIDEPSTVSNVYLPLYNANMHLVIDYIRPTKTLLTS